MNSCPRRLLWHRNRPQHVWKGVTFSSAAIDAKVDQDEVADCPNGVPNLEADAGDYTSVTDRIATSQNTIRATMILNDASTAMISKVEANG